MVFAFLPAKASVLLLFFREGVLRPVPGEALVEGSGLVQLAGLQGVQVFVCFQHEAVFHGSKTISQTAHMAGFDLVNQCIHSLLLILDLHGIIYFAICKNLSKI